MRLYLLMIATAAVALSSCGANPASVECADVPVVTIQPDQIFIQVGDTLTISAQFGPICPGVPGQRAGVFFWQSGNKAIVTIDSLTGRLHGLTAGQTTITATDTLDRSLKGTALVQVQARITGG